MSDHSSDSSSGFRFARANDDRSFGARDKFSLHFRRASRNEIEKGKERKKRPGREERRGKSEEREKIAKDEPDTLIRVSVDSGSCCLSARVDHTRHFNPQTPKAVYRYSLLFSVRLSFFFGAASRRV